MGKMIPNGVIIFKEWKSGNIMFTNRYHRTKVMKNKNFRVY